MLRPIPILSAFLLATALLAQNRLVGAPFQTRSVVWAKHGAAATSHSLATQVAIDTLQQGGSAVDAAIAANAMLCLCEPTGCGIGGDLFAIVWDPEQQKLHGLNGSGRSPRSLTGEHFAKLGLPSIPQRGALPVSVPGCVDGWTTLHERFGKLPLAQVLAPAIHHARAGVPVPATIAYYWQLNTPNLIDYPNFKETFLPWGRPPEPGDVFHNPGLADTLSRIAKDGRAGFYEGDVAKRISDHVRSQGGFLSIEDLRDHHAEWTDPVSTNYRGYEVWELPPNGQGIAALQILNLIEPYDVAAMGHGSREWIHLFTEAKKLAYEDRARWYADPAFSELPHDQLVAKLISKPYAKPRGKLLDQSQAATQYPPGDPRLEDGDTIYLTTADSSGMMVSWIQSNFRGMGSGMVPDGLGFNLQNRGELFDLQPGRPNSYAPDKRPFHTIIPAFVTKDGTPWLSFGVMGGAMQPQGHVQILVNMIDFGMNLQAAGDAPRMRHSGSSQPTGEQMRDGGVLNLEWGFDAGIVEALRNLGHEPNLGNSGFGGYQAILWDAERKVYAAASESRKDGNAAGY